MHFHFQNVEREMRQLSLEGAVVSGRRRVFTCNDKNRIFSLFTANERKYFSRVVDEAASVASDRLPREGDGSNKMSFTLRRVNQGGNNFSAK